MTETTVLKHNEAATEWALSEDRVPVFTVIKTVPNPDFGKPLEQQPERTAEPGEALPELVLDERETIEVSTVYTMPAATNAGLALKYLKKARENADAAASWLLELAVGSEGYDAFTDELSREADPDKALATMRTVIQSVAQRALGGLGKA